VGAGVDRRTELARGAGATCSSRILSRAYEVAIVVAMTAAEHLPLADVKNRLSEVVDRLEREHGRVVITKRGRPAAVVLSVEDLEGLEETLELLSDARAMRRIRQSQKDVDAGEVHELSEEQALSLVRRR